MFIIPLAGLSSRFFKSGYTKPKYQLMLNQKTMFSWSVESFKNYFDTDHFLFVCRSDHDTPNFIRQEINKLGIKYYNIVILDTPTQGQADTVFQGLKTYSDDEEIFIFNIDSQRENYIKPNWLKEINAYLEVFKGEGDHWSFIEPLDNFLVKKTTEKERISEFCSDGLYYFESSKKFKELVGYALKNNLLVNNELYIAPLYNILIKDGFKVGYDTVPQNLIKFCGTPEEYNLLLNGQ